MLQARNDAKNQTGSGGSKALSDVDKAVLAVIGIDSAVVLGIAEASRRQENEERAALLEVSLCAYRPDKTLSFQIKTNESVSSLSKMLTGIKTPTTTHNSSNNLKRVRGRAAKKIGDGDSDKEHENKSRNSSCASFN
jgi:hypothetical protein